LATLFLIFREDFVYEKGVKNGPAMLYGVSGATRKGQLRNGKWHGEATYTAQVMGCVTIFSYFGSVKAHDSNSRDVGSLI
jgi:hypothetical protein